MRFALLAALCFTLVPFGALARTDDDDAPIPFADEEKTDEEPRRELPRRSDESASWREESEYEQLERDKTLAGEDDPNIGVSGELVAGMMMIDSARGQLVESRAAWGLRFTWEWARLFLGDETLREALFADVTWAYAGMRDGTAELYGDTNYHYFSLAPAYAFALGSKSPYAVYAQVGLGLGYQFSALHVKGVETQIAGTKMLLQYGIGFRARPAVVADESVRISFRIEVTRFRRGYMDDTFLGGSVGATF